MKRVVEKEAEKLVRELEKGSEVEPGLLEARLVEIRDGGMLVRKLEVGFNNE